MSFTITDLIKLDKTRLSRKLYIKRRLISGSYEGSWTQIDNWNGRNRVISWGEHSVQIDESPGIIGAFEVSGIAIIADNNDGLFNIETSANSIWNPETTYLNRRYTKIKIDVGYLDDNDDIVGETTVFEGYIESVTLSEDGQATIECLSYQNIFTRYPINDLSLTGSATASATLTSILNQSKITDVLPYNAPSLTNDYTIPDRTALDGTYWDVIQEIAFTSSSTITLETDTFKVEPRTPGSVQWNFKGSGSDEQVDIYQILSYDDEGIGKIRVYFKEDGGSTVAQSTDATILLKYLSEPELVDLSRVDSSDKQGVLDDLLDKWENNIPVIEFEAKFLLNQISLLDKITLDIRGRQTPSLSEGGILWGSGATWGDGSLWGKELGGIIISSGVEWFVTMIIRNFEEGKMTVRAEKVV